MSNHSSYKTNYNITSHPYTVRKTKSGTYEVIIRETNEVAGRFEKSSEGGDWYGKAVEAIIARHQGR